MLDTSQDGRVGNLVAVEMQDRQHRAIGGRIEKLVGMPRRGQWSGLRLAIADDAGDDETGIVEHRPERMAERITQFAAFVDRARALWRCVAGDSSGKRKLNKELPKPSLILADVGIDLAVSALEISVAHHCRATVPGAGDVNHVEVVFSYDPVQVYVNEVLPRGRAPVSQQHVLHIPDRQRSLQQRIIVEINLANRQIVGGAPVGIHVVEQFQGKGFCRHGSIFLFSAKPRTRQTVLAIMLSSTVRMTRTATRLAAVEITPSFVAFRFSSSSIPRNPSPSQMRARTVGAFSPMPPANTSVSSPPNAAANAPIHFLTW